MSQAEAESASRADGFCSALRYNENLPDELEVVSAPDQHIPENIGGSIIDNPVKTFDVVRTDMVGIPGGLTLCTPLCDGFILPGGNERHKLFYDTMSETGLTHDSEKTKEEQRSNRRNYISAQAAYPNAGQAIQHNTGMWEMNGWTNPAATYTFVGFLEDADGATISDDRLSNVIAGADLADGTRAVICGFTPDLTLSTTKSDNFCEVELKYYEPDHREDDGDADFKEYGDRCLSPTYLCHEAAGPAWRMSPPPYVLFEHLGAAENTETPFATFFPENNKYREWHWVAAPAAPSCPVQEPGFSFDSGENTAPYLGHDLDVYTPITRIDGASTSPGPSQDYANAVAGGPTDTVLNTIEENTDLPPEVESAIDQAVASANGALNETFRQVSATQNQTIGDTSKDHRMEPNTVAARNPGSDTSQSVASVDRALEGACERAISNEEPDTVDPWVDIIDSRISETAAETTLYGNADPNQDDDNNPGPDRITTTGNVGLYTDKNDDGDYDNTGDPYRVSNIENTGAYPMLWNVKVETTDSGEAQITGDGSCEFTNTENTNLALDAQRMGYGPNTGLFQLIYLQEPTVADGNVLGVQERTAYTSGNNIYLLASQSVKTLWDGEVDPGQTSDFPLDNKVDSAIQELQAYADDKNGDQPAPGVVLPGDEFGYDSDFNHQCLASTGAFPAKVSFTHDCQQLNCEGDTVLTKYVFEVTNPSGQFNEGNYVPSFSGLNDATSDFAFGQGVHEWTDVDPLDGNPDRNDDNTQRPPT